MGKKHKTVRQVQLSKTEERTRAEQEALMFSRKRFKQFNEIVERIFSGEDLSRFFSDRRIWKVHDCIYSGKIKKTEQPLLKEVFLKLINDSVLMSSEQSIHAVLKMFLNRQYWKSDLFAWKPKNNRAEAQVNELAIHLFCKYEVPQFMFNALSEEVNSSQMLWFIQLGAGMSPVQLSNIPIPFTRKMGHYFLKASPKFTIQEALRWAQVKGLEGSDQLAHRIAYSWLGLKSYGNEDFWEGFIRLLSAGDMFNLDKLGELIDYVREAKRENKSYSLKGRTLSSLTRQSDEWHRRFTKKAGDLVWKSCGIEGFRIKKELDIVVLEELTEERLLIVEGKAMKHCVASYASHCAKGRSAIFSMRRYIGAVVSETLATIELNTSLKRIVQAKAKMNQPVSAEVKKYMTKWAEGQGLTLSPYL